MTIRTPSGALGSVAGLLLASLVASCGESPTNAPEIQTVVLEAKGGGPSVDAADPPEGSQGATLEVRVLGSGFDNGSHVGWLLNGVPAGKIQTLSTSYVSRSELVATISIDADADLDAYDIEVITGRGKKGVGVELFRVQEPGAEGPSYSVEAVELEGEGSAWAIATGAAGTHIVGTGGSTARDVWHMMLGGPRAVLPCEGPDTVDCRGFAGEGRGIDVGSDGRIVGARRQESPYTSNGRNRAAYWSDPSLPFADLPLPPVPAPDEAVFSGGVSVHAAGYAVGKMDVGDPSEPTNTVQRALLWTDDGAGGWTVRNLHEETFGPMSAERSWTLDVNARGQVVGGSSLGLYVWDDGAVVWIPEAEPSFSALNDADPVQVAGRSDNADGERRPMVWTVDAGAVQSVELPIGEWQADLWTANDINNHGHVAGSSLEQASGAARALVWIRDESVPGGYTLVDLGPGTAYGIDDVGLAQDGLVRVVGASDRRSFGKGRNRHYGTVPMLWTVRVAN